MEFIKKYAKYISLGLIILGVILMLFPCIGVNVFDSVEYKHNLFKATLGSTTENGVTILTANYVGIIMFILILINIVLPFISSKIKNFGYLISGILGYLITLIIFIFPMIVNRISSHLSYEFIGLPMLYIIAVIFLIQANLCMFKNYTETA